MSDKYVVVFDDATGRRTLSGHFDEDREGVSEYLATMVAAWLNKDMPTMDYYIVAADDL